MTSTKSFCILQVRVISNPDEKNEGGCTLVSTCDGVGSFGIKTSGRLVASFKKEPDVDRTSCMPDICHFLCATAFSGL